MDGSLWHCHNCRLKRPFDNYFYYDYRPTKQPALMENIATPIVIALFLS